LLETPKAIETTKETEMLDLNVKNSIDITMDNQQLSYPGEIRVESSSTRVKYSYIQVDGSGKHLIKGEDMVTSDMKVSVEKMVKENFYTYIYLDLRKLGNFKYGNLEFDYEPFYVGKGSNQRIFVHLERKDGETRKSRIIKNLLTLEVLPIMGIIEIFSDEKEAFLNESFLIKTIGRDDLGLGPLANLTDGGDGQSGFKFSKESKQRRSKRMKGQGNHQYGKIHPNTLKSISGPQINKCGEKNGMFGKGYMPHLTINNPMKNPLVAKKSLETRIKNTLLKLKELNLDFTEDNFNSVKNFGIPLFQNKKEVILTIWNSL